MIFTGGGTVATSALRLRSELLCNGLTLWVGTCAWAEYIPDEVVKREIDVPSALTGKPGIKIGCRVFQNTTAVHEAMLIKHLAIVITPENLGVRLEIQSATWVIGRGSRHIEIN